MVRSISYPRSFRGWLRLKVWYQQEPNPRTAIPVDYAFAFRFSSQATVLQAITRRCNWLRPVLVAQVKFTEWTHDDQLRQPVFLGVRRDKEAKEVVRE